MMTLPRDAEVALGLLQIIGLTLPVVFIALQPYYRAIARKSATGEGQNTGSASKLPKHERDPRLLMIGLGVVGAFLFGAMLIFAELTMLVESIAIRLALAVVFLGFVALGFLLWAVRQYFIEESPFA